MTPAISRDNSEWPLLKSWMTTRIHHWQSELERPIDERSSDSIRGKIAAYRELIKSVEPDRKIDPSSVEDGPLDMQVDY